MNKLTLRLLPLSALLLATTSTALTVTQRTRHINEVFSAAGITIVPCTVKLDNAYDLICGTTRLSTSLFQQSWDLYSDWSSKVTDTAKHLTAWSARESSNSASFIMKDSDYYVVLVSSGGTVTTAWPKAATGSVAGSASGTSSPTASSSTSNTAGLVRAEGRDLSTVVTANAMRTRVGPVLDLPGHRSGWYLKGAVKSMTRTEMEIQQAFGKDTEVLKTTKTITFTPEGYEKTSMTKDASGIVTDQSENTYAGGRIASRSQTNDGKTTRYTYEYDPAGNIATKTKYESGDTAVEVIRYTVMPNGYVATTYPKSGAPTSVRYVLQDAQGRDIEGQTTASTVWIRNTTKYDGDNRIQESLQSTALDLLTTIDGNQHRVVTTWKGQFAGLKPSPPTVTLYEEADQYGNATLLRKFDESIEFGKVVLKPTSAEYRTFNYY